MKEIIEILEETAPLSPAHRHVFKSITGHDIPVGCKSLEEYLAFKKDVLSQRNAGQKKQEEPQKEKERVKTQWELDDEYAAYKTKLYRDMVCYIDKFFPLDAQQRDRDEKRARILKYYNTPERVFVEYVCKAVDNYIKASLPKVWEESHIATYNAFHGERTTYKNPCSIEAAVLLCDHDYSSIGKRYSDLCSRTAETHRVFSVRMRDMSDALGTMYCSPNSRHIMVLHYISAIYAYSSLYRFAVQEGIAVHNPTGRETLVFWLARVSAEFELLMKSKEAEEHRPLIHILNAVSSQIVMNNMTSKDYPIVSEFGSLARIVWCFDKSGGVVCSIGKRVSA